MMSELFAPVRRATLWVPGTGPAEDPDRAHLFVILTNPCSDGMVLMVPICSLTNKADRTCLLGTGDHSFLKHPSFVAYYRLSKLKAATLVEQELRGAIKFRGMLDEKIFALICAGIEDSRQAPPILKAYYVTQTAPKNQ
jgi:hypothetical protein